MSPQPPKPTGGLILATHPPTRTRPTGLASLLLTSLLLVHTLSTLTAATPTTTPWSPTALAANPATQQLYIACATANQLAAFNPDTRTVSWTLTLPAPPLGLALSKDGSRLYATCAAPESTLCIIDTAQHRILDRIPTGHTTQAPVLSPDGQTLYACSRFDNEVLFIDLASRRITQRIPVPREPIAADITPDGHWLLVANHLQAGRADVSVVAATLSVIDTRTSRLDHNIPLPNGSSLLREVKVSPDGHHAVLAHQLSRFHLPTTQVERGWVNTSAATVIDLSNGTRLNTVLLDDIDAGAANPWAVAWSTDGRQLCVTHAGTHELSVINFPGLLEKLAKLPTTADPKKPAEDTAASRVASDVPNDLSFLVGLRRRIHLPATDRGPRALALIGNQAWIANYFTDSLALVDLAAPTPAPTHIAVHPTTTPSIERRGEALFNDASICFQGWQSCSSCHSSDARVDGMNWDNLNDGIGNPKNAKSLLQAHATPPSMWLGIRTNAYVAVRAGIRNSLFTVRPPADAEAIDAYLKSIRPIPGPKHVKGRLSASAERGRKLFQSDAVGCADCHKGELFTDLRFHDVGTVGKFDQPTDRFDTPSLVEVWRTAPYLHDGRAVTIRDVLTTANPGDRHGTTSHLKPAELNDLIEFILSL